MHRFVSPTQDELADEVWDDESPAGHIEGERLDDGLDVLEPGQRQAVVDAIRLARTVDRRGLWRAAVERFGPEAASRLWQEAFASTDDAQT